MPQGSRPDRVADQIRVELTELLGRHVKDPGIGFITITGVRLTTDLQLARVQYSSLGDQRARDRTAGALKRATPYLRRQLAARLRLRRVPELAFHFDDSLDRQERIEELLREIHAAESQTPGHDTPEADE